MADVRQLAFKFILIHMAVLAGCQRTVTWPASAIEMADRTVERQLVQGFYPVEANRWRWSAREFSVLLRPPKTAEQRGAQLSIEFYIPQSHFDALGPVTIFGNAGGEVLKEETFSKEGTYKYTRPIPPDLLATSILPVHFRLSKAVRATSEEGRELGVVVARIGLKSN